MDHLRHQNYEIEHTELECLNNTQKKNSKDKEEPFGIRIRF